MKAKTASVATALMTATALNPHPAHAASFGEAVAFLKGHTDVLVLSDKSGAGRVAVAPAWQGRVMTSTAGGEAGDSYGWINRDFIAAGKVTPHMNAFGGEDRFWLGPEGGQFSIFFAPGAKFEFANWFTPAALDTLPFDVLERGTDRAVFGKEFALTNYSGTHFEVGVRRTIEILDAATAWKQLGLRADKAVKLVAYASDNQITNRGPAPWKKETGLLSIWILGMYNPSPATTIVVPIQPGPDSALGEKVTADYFGEVPADRLVVRDTVIFLSADGKFRSKIGVNPRRSRAVLGSYDADHQVLTLVQFNQPKDVTDYVNSLWKLQDHPYGGDAANSYNDGPPTPGAKPMGPFYEIESSSPAAALAPGESLTHIHRTFHLSGPEPVLDQVAQAKLGVSLAQIKAAFQKR